jgi:hypothetical protein
MTWPKDKVKYVALSLHPLFKEQSISPSPTVVDPSCLIERIRKYMGFTAFLRVGKWRSVLVASCTYIYPPGRQ